MGKMREGPRVWTSVALNRGRVGGWGSFHPGSESGIKLMRTLAAGMPGFKDSLVHISYPNDSPPCST